MKGIPTAALTRLYPSLAATVNELLAAPPGPAVAGADDRRAGRRILRELLGETAAAGEAVRLNFVCTHNSRRSQLAQLWATVGGHCFRHPDLVAYSSGTEVTALNPRVIPALEAAGFRVEEGEGTKPAYAIRMGPDLPVIRCWSKRYDDASLPDRGVTAVMVCDHAEKNCPLIPGAARRVSLPFADPKAADGTPAEAAAYLAATRVIGAEVLGLFAPEG